MSATPSGERHVQNHRTHAQLDVDQHACAGRLHGATRPQNRGSTTSAAMALVCGNADLLSLHHLSRYAQLVAYENTTKQQVIGNDAFVLQVLQQVGNPAQACTTVECACKSYVQSFQDAAGYDFKLLHAL